MALYLPRKRSPQFLGPGTYAVDYSHPLAQGHLFTALGVSTVPLGRFRTPLTKTGAPVTAVNAAGQAFSFGTAADWSVPATQSGGQDPIPTKRVTYLIVRRKTDTTARASGFGTNSGERAGANIPWSDGNVYWDFGGNASPNRLTWSGYTASTNVEYWTFVAGARGSAIYFNGLQKATQGTAITRNASGTGLFMNSGNGAGSGDIQDVVLFAAFDAEWTPGQVLQWYAAPFDYLINQEAGSRFDAVAAVGGGSPTLTQLERFRPRGLMRGLAA